MRSLLRRRIKESFVDTAETVFTLREYPVQEVCAVEGVDVYGVSTPLMYGLTPEAGRLVNLPHTLRIFPARPARGPKTVNVKYTAGFSMTNVTPDLKEACFELTAWKYLRHSNRLSGIECNKKSDGSAFEIKMPERVKELLEPYRRKVI
jgi:hypothetical protein